MTTNLAKQKENLEAYIRSTGYNTRGMNVENNHVLIEKPILDSYEDEHQRKELVDLVNVIETRTIPQGLTSLLAFDGSKTIEENQERMTAALTEVVSGSVTTAVRDTTIDGLEIHENDNLGMVDGKIVVSNPDMLTALKETFSKMLNEDSEIVSIYIGEDGSEELASSLAQDLMEQFEDVEVEIHQGSQPVYPYIFSVE